MSKLQRRSLVETTGKPSNPHLDNHAFFLDIVGYSYARWGIRAMFDQDAFLKSPVPEVRVRNALASAKSHVCSKCDGDRIIQKNDTDSEPCPECKGSGRMQLKREDGKTLKPEGWKPPDIQGEINKQRLGSGSLQRVLGEF